jgi:hypothetical protein
MRPLWHHEIPVLRRAPLRCRQRNYQRCQFASLIQSSLFATKRGQPVDRLGGRSQRAKSWSRAGRNLSGFHRTRDLIADICSGGLAESLFAPLRGEKYRPWFANKDPQRLDRFRCCTSPSAAVVEKNGRNGPRRQVPRNAPQRQASRNTTIHYPKHQRGDHRIESMRCHLIGEFICFLD